MTDTEKLIADYAAAMLSPLRQMYDRTEAKVGEPVLFQAVVGTLL